MRLCKRVVAPVDCAADVRLAPKAHVDTYGQEVLSFNVRVHRRAIKFGGRVRSIRGLDRKAIELRPVAIFGARRGGLPSLITRNHPVCLRPELPIRGP